MTDKNDDDTSNRGLASADKGTRERVARMGGEASHRNDDKGSAGGGRGGSSSRGSSVGSSGGRGGSSGGRGGEGKGIWYDKAAGQCRDESGLFVECPEGMGNKGTRDDPNKQHISSKGGEARAGERGGGSSGGDRSGSSGGGSSGGRGGSSGGRD